MVNQVKAKGLTILSGSPASGASLLGYGIAAKLADRNTRTILIDLDSGRDISGAGFSYRHDSDMRNVGYIELAEMTRKTDAGFEIAQLPQEETRIENEDSLEYIYAGICDLSSSYESVIISAPGGLNPLAMLAAGISEEVLLVIDADASSVASSYCLLKTLVYEEMSEKITVIFTNVESARQADSLKNKFDSITEEFLNLKLKNGGFLPPYPDISVIGSPGMPESGRVMEYIENTHFDTLNLFQIETTLENPSGIDSTMDDPDDLKMDNH